jgi:hypothetical protein
VVRHCEELGHKGLIEMERIDTGKLLLISPEAFEPEALVKSSK